jgi:hypothetical protein
MNKTTVITHNGVIHLDELLAMYLLDITPNTIDDYNIIRIPAYKFDETLAQHPDAIVLDIGGVSDGIRRFDHHQRRGMDCTAKQVYDVLYSDYCPNFSSDLSLLINHTNECDNGKPCDVTSVYGLVRNLNNTFHDFYNIFNIVYNTIFLPTMSSDHKSMIGYNNIQSCPIINDFVDMRGIPYVPRWKEFVSNDIVGSISNNQQNKSCIQLTVKDSSVMEIAPDPLQSFRHPSGFMAVYRDGISIEDISFKVHSK